MYIAMNRFMIVKGREADFEAIWRNRDSHLKDVPGFHEFHLLRGPEEGEGIQYSSHSLWDSRAAFENWTKSESFRRAHAGAGASKGMYMGPPKFEGFEVVLDERKVANG